MCKFDSMVVHEFLDKNAVLDQAYLNKVASSILKRCCV